VNAENEAAVAAGTVLLKPAELAPRVGLGNGRKGRSKVIARAKAGLIPVIHPSPRVWLFRWPDVVAAMQSNSRKRGAQT